MRALGYVPFYSAARIGLISFKHLKGAIHMFKGYTSNITQLNENDFRNLFKVYNIKE
jgi:hypothetical protein